MRRDRSEAVGLEDAQRYAQRRELVAQRLEMGEDERRAIAADVVRVPLPRAEAVHGDDGPTSSRVGKRTLVMCAQIVAKPDKLEITHGEALWWEALGAPRRMLRR